MSTSIVLKNQPDWCINEDNNCILFLVVQQNSISPPPYIRIFNFHVKTKYDNVFHIQDKINSVMLHLINQVYLLLFERTLPLITPKSQDIY